MLGLLAALLSHLVWISESWPQNIAHVGILTMLPIDKDPMAQVWLESFRRTLAEHGWVEGKNLAFEFRDANGDPSGLVERAADLAGLKLDVVYCPGAPSARAAHAAIHTIPIVVTDYTADPVAEGYVESYAHPGGNLTGVFLDAPEFAGKWLQLLKAIVPDLTRIAVLWDPNPGRAHLHAVQALARSFAVQLQVFEARNPDDLDKVFSAFQGKPQAVILLPSPMIYAQSERLARLTLKHRLPAISMARLFADSGGALAYGPEETSTHARGAALVARILRGAKPGDLPVDRPTKVQLIVNLKTAKVLGLTVPETVLYRADEVIR
jgi:putative ABC transport system substrate-binding protein